MGMQFTVFSFTPNTVLCMPSHLLLRICPDLKTCRAARCCIHLAKRLEEKQLCHFTVRRSDG